jgi:hypothetical protein
MIVKLSMRAGRQATKARCRTGNLTCRQVTGSTGGARVRTEIVVTGVGVIKWDVVCRRPVTRYSLTQETRYHK